MSSTSKSSEITKLLKEKLFVSCPPGVDDRKSEASGSPADVELRFSGKITIVGIGAVGMACATSILHANMCRELVLIDIEEDRLEGERMDLQHAQAVTGGAKIVSGTNYALSAGSSICVVTAGARQKNEETRLSLLRRNVGIFKKIIPQLARESPDSVLVIVSNPVDVMTAVAHRLSGFPVSRVIGSGTALDSARFRLLIASELNVNPRSVHAWVIGEHGDSSVCVWSTVNLAGSRLNDIIPGIGSTEFGQRISNDVRRSAYEIIRLKGYTSWAIGDTVAKICDCIRNDSGRIFSLSTMAKGLYGIDKDVFISLPCVLGRTGIRCLVPLPLNNEDLGMLKKSADTLWECY